MYAEAVVMGGKATANITPLEAINKVRDRVGVPHVTEANMRTIEDERILELTYEGFRFFDLLRWGKVVERFRELEILILCLKGLAGLNIWGLRKIRMNGFHCQLMK